MVGGISVNSKMNSIGYVQIVGNKITKIYMSIKQFIFEDKVDDLIIYNIFRDKFLEW